MFKIWIMIVCFNGSCIAPGGNFDSEEACRDYIGFTKVNIEREKPDWVKETPTYRCALMQETVRADSNG